MERRERDEISITYEFVHTSLYKYNVDYTSTQAKRNAYPRGIVS